MHDESHQPQLLLDSAVDKLIQAMKSLPASEIRQVLKTRVFKEQEESKDSVGTKLDSLFDDVRTFVEVIEGNEKMYRDLKAQDDKLRAD